MLDKIAPRMYVRIYLTVIGCLLAAVVLFGAVHFFYNPADNPATADLLADFAGKTLPPQSAPPEAQQRALQHWRHRLHADVALYGADRKFIAGAGRPLPLLNPNQQTTGSMYGSPAVYALQMEDGRWLLARRMIRPHLPVVIAVLLCFIAVVVAVGAYPVVRRITRNLETLESSVVAWGKGDLGARVAVEGRDEVAQLASSFNASAERIEALVAAQKSLLANASHELRSPLARIRMATELMEGAASPALRAELAHNIAELDQLIDELLLASRLDAAHGDALAMAPVDLTAIVAEECARVDAAFDAVAVTVMGDARLLRRLVRNLLENGKRHGGGTPVEASLALAGGMVRLDVCDHGPGVPELERERIFEPFYRLPGASETAGGVGLGLSLVRQIARRHGGDAVCLPPAGGGTCFRVSLPADGAAASSRA